MFSFNVFSFSFVVYLLEGQGSWTSFINTYCLKEIKIEMRRPLRLKKVRILLNNKYSFLVFISESVCVLENTLSLVLGYYPAVLLLTGTCFFSSLQLRLFSAASEKSSMKRRCKQQTFGSITKVKPWQPTFLLNRFFVTGKPFWAFFSFPYCLIYFNWKKLSCNASIGKWGGVKTWNRFLGVLVLS